MGGKNSGRETTRDLIQTRVSGTLFWHKIPVFGTFYQKEQPGLSPVKTDKDY